MGIKRYQKIIEQPSDDAAKAIDGRLFYETVQRIASHRHFADKYGNKIGMNLPRRINLDEAIVKIKAKGALFEA